MTATPKTDRDTPVLGDELRQLVQRAEQGDRTALAPLRQFLDQTPALWRRYGDLAEQAELTWLNLVCGNNLALHESVTRRLAELRSELGGEAASALEKLLVDRVVTSWLQVHYADINLAHHKDRHTDPALARPATHLLDRAQARYLAAIKQLATVRKLLRPTLSPIEVATRLGGHPPAARGRQSSLAREGALAAAN